MFRHTRSIIVLTALFLVVLSLSGCYTIVGYPPDARESMGKRHGEKAYRDYEYYESPYLEYGEYYLYDFYPYYYDSYSYRYRPWLYDGGYYWDDDYQSYAPEKKPEVRKRSVIEPSRTDNSTYRQQKEPAKDDSNEKQNSSDDDKKSNRRYR